MGDAAIAPSVDAAGGPVADAAVVLTPDAVVGPTPDAVVVPTPDAAVVLPADAAVVLPADAAVVPTPDAAVVSPVDAAVALTPDAAVVSPVDAAVVLTPDATEVSPVDAAVVLTPDAVVVEAPDSAVVPMVDAGVVPVADADVVSVPDAGPVCGSLGCMTVASGEVDLRNRVARILGHLAACGPAINPAGAVEVRLDDARYTLPPGSLRPVDGQLEACVGAGCAVPVALPMARAVFRPAFAGFPAGLVINGTSIRAPDASDDLVSTVSIGVSAIAYAAAINDSRCMTGVAAVPGITLVMGREPVSAGELSAESTIIINDVPVPPTMVDDLDDGGLLVAAIDGITERTGVDATLEADGRLVLMAADGRNIHVVVGTAEAEHVTGLSRHESNWARQGVVHLHSLRPFEYWYEWPNRWESVQSEIGSDGHRLDATLVDPFIWPFAFGRWTVNNVLIRTPTRDDDPASTFEPEHSGIAYAAAINESTELHGATARAVPTSVPLRPFAVVREGHFGGPPIIVNGVNVPDVDFRAGDANGALASAIASVAGLTGVQLTFMGSQPFLVAPDGRNLEVYVHSDLAALLPTVTTVYGAVELRSASQIRLERSDGWTTVSQTSIEPADVFDLPRLGVEIDALTGTYELTVGDTSIACVTPLDGVDVTLDVGALAGRSFIPTQIVAPGRYAGVWPFCE
jgi:hypothetical protein